MIATGCRDNQVKHAVGNGPISSGQQWPTDLELDHILRPSNE